MGEIELEVDVTRREGGGDASGEEEESGAAGGEAVAEEGLRGHGGGGGWGLAAVVGVGRGLSDCGCEAFKLGRQHRSLWSQSGNESWGPD